MCFSLNNNSSFEMLNSIPSPQHSFFTDLVILSLFIYIITISCHYTMVSLAMDIIMNMPLLVMHMVVGVDQVYLH